MLVGLALQSTPSLITAHWNIGILLHKQAKRTTITHTTVYAPSKRFSMHIPVFQSKIESSLFFFELQ